MNRPQGPRTHRRLRQISQHITWFLGTRFPKALPFVFVVGYPKSGTTWVSQLVADYLRLSFPQYSILPIGCEAVVQGHQRVWKRYPRGVYVLRDGRDVLTSHYFWFVRFIAEGNHPPLKRLQRRHLPGLVNKANVHANITRFVERQMKRPDSVRVRWSEHVRSYFEVDNPNMVLARYEDFLRDGSSALAAVVSHLTGEEAEPDRVEATLQKYAFRRVTGRRRGEEDRSSTKRKGQQGDWVNHFTVEAAEIFDRYCGDMLIKTGYEPDHSWVQSFRAGAGRPRSEEVMQPADGAA